MKLTLSLPQNNKGPSRCPAITSLGDIFYTWLKNTGGRALSYRSKGSEFFQLFSNPRFDLACIDAVHTYEAVRDDIAGCLTVLKPSGKLAGHDCHPQHFPGAYRAVDESAARLG